MKIGILLSGRYPTEKAYGVTTKGTIASLVGKGHKVTLYAMNSESADEFKINSDVSIVYYAESKIAQQLKRIALRNFGYINQTAWLIYWRLVMQINRQSISEMDFDLIWLRDLHMIKFISNARRIIFEIHQDFKVSRLTRFMESLKCVELKLAPISKYLLRKTCSIHSDVPIVWAPMGIDSNSIASIDDINEFSNRVLDIRFNGTEGIKVGYVGKFFPNGYSKGIEDLINLALLNKEQSDRFEISLTGGTNKELEKIAAAMESLKLRGSDIEINSHISHSEALIKMSRLDVLVLPMPNSSQYVGFPLKCIEAIATGRVVIVAKCQIYEDIFTNIYQPYWYIPGDVQSLRMSINSAINDPKLIVKIEAGVEFAKQFTWDIRTSRILGDWN